VDSMKAMFLGSKAFGIRTLDCLRTAAPAVSWTVVHPVDRADSRSVFDDFRSYGVIHDLHISLVPSSLAAKELIADISPDIVFVCGWYWRLDQATLQDIPHGVFGIHNSLLPRYRGGAPLVWSIINGDPEVGASVFRFTPGLDDGDLVAQVRVANEEGDTINTIANKIEQALLPILPGIWLRILDGSIVLTKQHESDATYCGQRTPDDGRIDWNWPAQRVHNFIRAQTLPYPGAFSTIDDQKVVVLLSEPDPRIFYGTPGQVLFRGDGKLLVSCGEATAITIVEMLIDGLPQVPASVIRSVSARFR